MAKGDTDTARNMIKTESGQVNAEHGLLSGQLQNERSDVYNRGVSLHGDITTNANNLYNNPLDPTVIANLRGYSRPGSSGSGGGGGESGGGGGGGGEAATPAAPAGSKWSGLIDWGKGAASSGLVDVSKLESAIPGFKEIAATGGFDPAALSRINANIGKLTEFGTTGAFDPAAKSAIEGDIGALRTISQSGGLRPEAQALMDKIIQDFYGMGTDKYGGVDTESVNRIRGNGIFDEFVKTGGYTPEQIALMRQKATSVIPALYANQQRNINRLGAIRGGYAPGQSAQMAQLMRGRGQALSDASREAELGIQKEVTAGRKWGGEQMTGAEQALAALVQQGKVAGLTGAGNLSLGLEDLISGNKIQAGEAAGRLGTNLESGIAANRLAGARDAMTGETTLQQNIAGNKLTGLKGITDTYGQSEGLQQQGKLGGANVWAAGLSGQSQEEQAAAALAAAEAANSAAISAANDRYYAGLGSENEQYIGKMIQAGQMGGLGALGDLYGTAPGEMSMYQGNLGNLAGQRGQLQGGLINQQLKLASQPGLYDKIIQGVGAGAGLLSAFGSGGMSAIPAITKPRNETPAWPYE